MRDGLVRMSKTRLKTPKGAKRAGTIERTDAALGAAAVKHRGSRPVRVVGWLAGIADQPPMFAISAATIAGGLLLRRPQLIRAGVRMLASEAVATGAKGLIKHYVARTRPRTMLKDGRYAAHGDDGARDEGPWNSFPSGHTAGAVAVGRALVREYPAAAPLVTVAVGAIALVQPFTGAHFPSDVAAGAVTGWASEAAVDGVVRGAGFA